MAVRIRLKKFGATNKPSYRVVVADARSQRDGRIIENLGYYNPRQKDEKINVERAQYWVKQGAQPSETVQRIMRRAKSEQE